MLITQRANRTVVTEVLLDYYPLIRRIARCFARRYMREYDEILGDAQHIFLQVYHSHDPCRMDFERRLRFKIWNRLLDKIRQECRNHARLKRVPMPLQISETTPEPFDLDSLICGVSRDARIVLRCLFDTPPELLHHIRTAEPTPVAVRMLLRAWCRRVHG